MAYKTLLNNVRKCIYYTINGNGNTNGVFPSFLDGELVKEFEC
jgi:hypothetical protein